MEGSAPNPRSAQTLPGRKDEERKTRRRGVHRQKLRGGCVVGRGAGIQEDGLVLIIPADPPPSWKRPPHGPSTNTHFYLCGDPPGPPSSLPSPHPRGRPKPGSNLKPGPENWPLKSRGPAQRPSRAPSPWRDRKGQRSRSCPPGPRPPRCDAAAAAAAARRDFASIPALWKCLFIQRSCVNI